MNVTPQSASNRNFSQYRRADCREERWYRRTVLSVDFNARVGKEVIFCLIQRVTKARTQSGNALKKIRKHGNGFKTRAYPVKTVKEI